MGTNATFLLIVGDRMIRHILLLICVCTLLLNLFFLPAFASDLEPEASAEPSPVVSVEEPTPTTSTEEMQYLSAQFELQKQFYTFAMGVLLFFVAVVIAYFGYKFFKMFF